MSDDSMPWWGALLIAIGTAFGIAVATKLVDKILKDKKLTPEEKLSRLDDALREAKISREEWQKARDSVMSNYASDT